MLMGLLTYAVSEYRKLSLSPFTEVDVLFVNIIGFHASCSYKLSYHFTALCTACDMHVV